MVLFEQPDSKNYMIEEKVKEGISHNPSQAFLTSRENFVYRDSLKVVPVLRGKSLAGPGRKLL